MRSSKPRSDPHKHCINDNETSSPPFSKPIDGQLSKYTNVMKGWQYRWFVLYPSKGIIEYYEVRMSSYVCCLIV